MCKNAIVINNIGKMYKLYKNPKDKILDAFNLNFFKKNYYEEFWALRNMSLTIKKGERVGLIGNNGAGKSTLLKLIIGNVVPTEGVISVDGEIQALMELGTGFHPEFTGRQNIRASLAYRGLSEGQIKEKEEEIIDFSELEDFIDQPIRTYSAGMNARLAFSTATAISPDILIVDEVLGAGDAYFAGKSVERMKKITQESGATVLFVSHDLNSVLQLCDRIIWIDKGKIRKQGNPVEVVKEYSASVRKREELRLKARDKRKYNRLIENDLSEKTLFRIITKDGLPPKKINKIYKVDLYGKDKEIFASIDIGGPMDNGVELESFVIVDKDYTNWGNSKSDEKGTYREYIDLGGKYIHAPFKLDLSTNLSSQNMNLEIEADVEDELIIQIYKDNNYIDLGMLNYNGFKKYNFNINKQKDYEKDIDIERFESNILINDVESSENTVDINSKYEYGNKKIEIKNIKMLNENNEETRILELEEKLTVEVEFFAREKIFSPTFVFCVYMTDGKCASQWIADNKVYGDVELKGRGIFRFNIEKLLLGKGTYIASMGIFNGLSSLDIEAESYHVIDRSIHFEIKQKVGETIERGICLQPFEGVIIDER